MGNIRWEEDRKFKYNTLSGHWTDYIQRLYQSKNEEDDEITSVLHQIEVSNMWQKQSMEMIYAQSNLNKYDSPLNREERRSEERFMKKQKLLSFDQLYEE